LFGRVFARIKIRMRPPRIPHSILFVCLGNICRSPAAEIVFRKQAADAGLADGFHVDSAGTIGHHAGSPPDPRMSEALRHRGYTVTGRSRKIRSEDLRNFDLIVTMDESNFSDVRWLDPEGRFHDKIRPFVSFCQRHGDPRVPDPYYGGQRGFDYVITLIEDGCEGILTELCGAASPGGRDFQLE
jgi:protein-tyrosine phosphatase